ncbi:urease accessory protein UreD [Sulfitobacter donghicola]|uniref:Urease accessory protein UreD n=1 Tax=Sulfitobacter donghicola DSW-25 = KCTC 12864 = JCM 14565 TaxID=1300350 RepID=A0A073IKP4_9RHOB|nr:urease accessory protein UreD [Sulfitobacter donghicola]KEJ90140.1 urease accessory protein ureD [Sulfitobacter donghicola DSW-25 = KCTC 12864 = JCM 14565]KIN66705.1 Urease accessory protein UreD [Sulfitobacter donghicola DSW-25 = KCTC 12864 = JCM 14565]
MQQNQYRNQAITAKAAHKIETAIGPVPRTKGTLMLSSKRVEGTSGINRFRTSGAMKALFPRADDLQAILINTSGGLTGGDQIDISASASEGSTLTLTTQAAERAYRAHSGRARMTATLQVEANAQINWLPQEMILFEGSALDRHLTVDLDQGGRFLMVEPIIFGRAAMGETLTSVSFKDRVRINRGGKPLYWDGLDLDGDTMRHLSRRAVAGGARAMVSLAYVAPNAETHLEPLRNALPATGGCSLLGPDLLTLRLIAADGFEMRKTLMPILERLTNDQLPTSWRL